jgi:hypothetical protein
MAELGVQPKRPKRVSETCFNDNFVNFPPAFPSGLVPDLPGQGLSARPALRAPVLHRLLGPVLAASCTAHFHVTILTISLQKILNEGRVNVQCPAERCTVAVDEDFARARLKPNGEKALEHLARIQLNSFVEGNPLLKWCPGPNCGRAAKAQLSEARRIKCTCGNTYCFQCGQVSGNGLWGREFLVKIFFIFKSIFYGVNFYFIFYR